MGGKEAARALLLTRVVSGSQESVPLPVSCLGLMMLLYPLLSASNGPDAVQSSFFSCTSTTITVMVAMKARIRIVSTLCLAVLLLMFQ